MESKEQSPVMGQLQGRDKSYICTVFIHNTNVVNKCKGSFTFPLEDRNTWNKSRLQRRI